MIHRLGFAATRPRSKLTAAAMLGALLQACAPVSDSYLRIEAPDAKHFKSTCSGSVGAPVITYYPFHGIFISVNPDPVFLGLHVPEGMLVQLDSDTITISGSTKDGQVTKQIRLRLDPQKALGFNVPPDFRRLPDPFRSDVTTLGSLTGASANGFHRWYLLRGADRDQPDRFVGPPRGLIEGTLEIPSMTINGQRYPAQVLPIKKARYFTVMPVNC